MLVTNNERYKFKVKRRKENTDYQWEENVSLEFFGRPANQVEKKQYRIQQGVNGNSDSVYVLASNLPSELNIKDKVIYLGKEWTVMSIGYYFDQSRFVNPGVMSEEAIIRRCPKGINLQ